VRQGAAAVTGDALARIADWYGEPRLRAT
jgi:hypothetical protein